MKDRAAEVRVFEQYPIVRAVLALAVPTVISQIILVIYNMADTFFIGLTGSDAKITAVTVCMPAFMFLNAIANLFGVGGAAAIARALGEQKPELRIMHQIPKHGHFQKRLVGIGRRIGKNIIA